MKQSILVVASGLALLPAVAFAQAISYVTPGAQVFEDFNNPAEGGWGENRTEVWDDGQTFNGWYALYFNGNSGLYAKPPSFGVSSGAQFSSTNNNLYVFRDPDVAHNGALGAQQTDGITGSPANGGGVFFGVQIQNNTAAHLTQFSLGFTGEQWRVTTVANPNTLAVSYSTDASAVDGIWLNTGSWTDIPELLFTAPHTGASSNTALDGNAAENRIVFAPQTITLASALAPGESLYIRWFSQNIGGVDHSVGIDDFVFAAIPEPTTYALIFGVAVLAAAGVRRFRRRNAAAE